MAQSYEEAIIKIFFFILESITEIVVFFGVQLFEVIGINSEENLFVFKSVS